jgi:signal transduction histidine kinase
LYRIAQEAISNAYKHGKASEVHVDLKRDRDRMTLTIRDNGVGMPQTLKGANQGIGLHIMRYRAGAIGGEVTILPGRKSGSAIMVSYGGKPASKRV